MAMLAPVPNPVPNAIAAALQNPTSTTASPFTWGAGGAPITAAALARQRKITDALRPTKAPTGPWSLLGDLADEGVASYRDAQGNDQERKAQQSVADALGRKDYIGAMGSDFATPQQEAVASALQGRDWQAQDRQAQWAHEAAIASAAEARRVADPAYQADLAKTKAETAMLTGGSFRGDSMDAQAWNILQRSDPSSPEYATAYSIVSQPKTQLVQTANGMVPVQVPPQLPSWLVAPGAAKSDGGAPGAQAAPDGGAPGADPSAAPENLGAPVPAPPAANGTAAPVPSAAPNGSAPFAAPIIPGTKQPATEMQARNGAISKILLNEVPTLGKTFTALADPQGQLLAALPANLGNPWQSEDYQRAAGAVKTTVANVLYSLSGASSNPGEVVKQIEVLTPAFGDKPGVIADKLNRFKNYVRSIASESNDPELEANVEKALSQVPDLPAGGSAATSKTINGVTYTQGADGKWYAP